MALPSGLEYFRVTGKFLAGIADGADAGDEPDIIPVSGGVLFTPEVTATQLLGEDPVNFFLDNVEAVIDDDGVLKDRKGGSPTVPLISPFSPGLVNKNWKWTVTFNLGLRKKVSFPFQPGEPGEVINLAKVTPLITTPETLTIKGEPGDLGPQGLSAYQVAVAGGFVGTESEWLTSLRGADGQVDPEVLEALQQDIADAGTSNADPNTVVRRDGEGTFWASRVVVADVNPPNNQHLVPRGYVDTAVAAAKARANHTGTQTSASISDLTEAVQDIVGAFFGAGTGASVTYNDAANTLTISATGTSDPEAIRDAIGVALVGVGNISVTVNDVGDTITVSTTATVNSTDAALRDRSTHTGTQSLDSTTDSGTRLAMTAAERTKLGGVATGATAYTDEQAEDTAAGLFTTGTHTGISFTYDDTGRKVNATVTGGGTGGTGSGGDGISLDSDGTPFYDPTAAGSSSLSGWFGDGSDGTVTISTATTLTRDMHYNNLTVTATGSINAAGYRVVVKGDCVVDAGGAIHNDGGNAATNAGGLGGSQSSNQRTLGRGGRGQDNTGNASAPTGQWTNNSLGGGGGSGGVSTGGAVAPGTGAVPTGSAWLSAVRPINSWRMLPARLLGHTSYQVNDEAAHVILAGGGGGGAGGGAAAGENNGGGGGGGGVLVLVARRIVNNGRISANGGNGGAGQANMSSGGGGGGGGGVALVTCGSNSGTGVVQANGGVGGPGQGAGANGNPGTAGLVSVMILGA